MFIGIFNQNDVDNILRESTHMKKLDHSNVMGLVGLCIECGLAPYLILPYMAGSPN